MSNIINKTSQPHLELLKITINVKWMDFSEVAGTNRGHVNNKKQIVADQYGSCL